MESLVVKNFKKYKDILTILDAKYTTNKNTITEHFKNILPKIRLGGEDGKLTEIFNKYTESAFNFGNVKSFLDVRSREIQTISYVLKKAEKSTKVTVDYGGTGDGNNCIQVCNFINLLMNG